ncbi:hypothetical protein C1H76_6932 [Elsinoe australis]|uniref:AMP-activated protein kinase glycogen-binding domain-containing protein n=1 Tax=Elsinoe australis TaxID=40998 RepID=A0A4U7AUR9_9PEZI|nr:hypothetical protein C1H76_6932 [Elsinoe australis]
MGSYVFKWPHAANEVYVTGTFDDWSKSQKLENTGSGFEKKVDLHNANEKIYYKFVVDGNWTTDHTAPSETDHEGNVNNVLKPEHILSSAAPTSSTAALAGQVPLEKEKGPSSELPGQFPETPANENQNFSVNPLPATSGASNPIKLAPGEKVPESSKYTSDTVGSNVTLDKESYERGGSGATEQTFSVNPIPATSGAGNPVSLAPGEKVPDSSSYTNNTLDSNVRLDKESYEKGGSGASEQTFSVNPIPATAGAGNPIKLAPGEKVPEPTSYTSGTIDSNVRLDKESYEKSGSGPPQLPPVLNKQEEAEAGGASMFGVPPVGSGIIPESSLPMRGQQQQDNSADGPTISSVAPQSTTAQLAGQQPIEPRGVPHVVADSQKTAHAAPEASQSTEAVQEKAQVEEEIKDKVPEAPATSESGALGKSEKGVLGAAAAGVAGAAAATTAQLAGKQPIEPRGVPEVVTESQQTAHASPEASKSTEAVQEKAQVEEEIKEKVPEAPATSESGLLGKSEKGVIGTAAAGVAAAGAAAAGAAYAAKDKVAETTGTQPEKILPTTVQDTTVGATGDKTHSQTNGVPEIVTESQEKAHADPEASASAEAVKEKSEVEKELEQKVKPTQEAGEPAPTATAATSATAPVKAPGSKPSSDYKVDAPGRTLEPSPAGKADESRDVSPMTKPGEASAAPKQNETTVTAGGPSTPQKARRTSSFFRKTPATPDSTRTPQSDTASPSSDAKKNKRKSFFGKIKEKLSSH